MSILRSHSREPYHPARGSTRDICMHYGGLLRPSHTAASMIVALKPGCKPLILASISPYPCLSAYKPIPFGFNPPVSFKETSNKYNPENYWWVHRRLKSLLQSCYYSQVVREYINGVRGIEEEYLKPLILEYSEGKCVEDESYSILESMIEAENKLLTKASKAISGKYCWRHPFHTLILKKSDGKAGF
ncbi:MAG: hypothetical protein OWQ48_01475 [Desulfurococcus sp.]|nr:hypothetical protein [Desulfurococcus sp.]